MNRISFLINIKDLRTDHSLTQEELANQLGISRQSLIAIENGRFLPSLSLACQIAKFFDITIDKLLLDDQEDESILTISESEESKNTQPNPENQLTFQKINRNLIPNQFKENKMKNNNLAPWSPFRDLGSVDEEFNRFFNHWPSLGRMNLNSGPAINIRQDEKNVSVEVQVPGFTEADIDVDVAESYLTISGQQQKEKEESKKGYFRREYVEQNFSRTVALPTKVNSEKAEASLKDGVLIVTIPKLEPEKPKSQKITVKRQ